jgi:DNA-binding NarL/FixJ family response regulator
MVVGNDPHDRVLVARELKNTFIEVQVLEASDRAQFEEFLRRDCCDLVITDYKLRDWDGIELLSATKQRWPNCPVIMFTESENEAVAVEAMKLGLEDYVVKEIPSLARLGRAARAAIRHAMLRCRADQLAARLESLLDQSRSGVFCCSSDGQFLEVNPAMLDLLRCGSLQAAKELSVVTLFSNGAEGQAFLRRLVNGADPVEAEFESHPSLGKRMLRITAKWRSPDDPTEPIDGLVEDITERKLLEIDARRSVMALTKVRVLSERERQVFDQVVAGKPNKVIARQLQISEKTVEKHRGNLMRKLQCGSVAALVRLAMQAERAELMESLR